MGCGSLAHADGTPKHESTKILNMISIQLIVYVLALGIAT